MSPFPPILPPSPTCVLTETQSQELGGMWSRKGDTCPTLEELANGEGPDRAFELRPLVL